MLLGCHRRTVGVESCEQLPVCLLPVSESPEGIPCSARSITFHR